MIANMNEATDKRDNAQNDPEFELECIEKLYLMGDFRRVRRKAKRLLTRGLTDEQRTATANLLAATGIDPIAIVAFIITAATLATIVLVYAN